MNGDNWQALLGQLRMAAIAGETSGDATPLMEPIATADDQQLLALLAALSEFAPPEHVAVDRLLEQIFSLLGQRIAGPVGDRALPPPLLDRLVVIERQLASDSRARMMLLRMLAESKQQSALAALAERLVVAPPPDPSGAVTAMAPLFRQRDLPPAALFPRLLDTLQHPAVAAVTLDLANFLTRASLAPIHPAFDRRQQLMDLLGQLIQRLARLEEHPPTTASEARQAGLHVIESVSLIVASIDALALIGDVQAVGKLYQALDLHHRRIRTEAAAALVRLGEREAGIEHLASLAAFPIARLRVVAYAEELGVLDEIPEPRRDAVACAEAELVCWLAEPTQFGTPPACCELIDERTQYWPGYDEPVDCYLFRFEYPSEEGSYSNIGLAGPATWAFSADMADLSLDDIYAAFAGWQAEHGEIYEISPDRFYDGWQGEVARLERRLRDEGIVNVQPLRLGIFFGERVLIARGQRQGEQGTAIADAMEVHWYPAGRSDRPLGPTEGFSIYKGRKLLRSFNP